MILRASLGLPIEEGAADWPLRIPDADAAKKPLRSRQKPDRRRGFLYGLLFYFCIFLFDTGEFPDDLDGSVCAGLTAVDAQIIAF